MPVVRAPELRLVQPVLVAGTGEQRKQLRPHRVELQHVALFGGFRADLVRPRERRRQPVDEADFARGARTVPCEVARRQQRRRPRRQPGLPVAQRAQPRHRGKRRLQQRGARARQPHDDEGRGHRHAGDVRLRARGGHEVQPVLERALDRAGEELPAGCIGAGVGDQPGDEEVERLAEPGVAEVRESGRARGAREQRVHVEDGPRPAHESRTGERGVPQRAQPRDPGRGDRRTHASAATRSAAAAVPPAARSAAPTSAACARCSGCARTVRTATRRSSAPTRP